MNDRDDARATGEPSTPPPSEPTGPPSTPPADPADVADTTAAAPSTAGPAPTPEPEPAPVPAAGSRRTVLLVAAAVVLVVAVVVTAVVIATRGDDGGGTAQVGATSTSASPGPSSAPGGSGGGIATWGPEPPATADGLAEGEPTTLGVVGATGFRTPDGREVTLDLAPEQGISIVVPAEGGWFVELHEPAEILFVGEDGSVGSVADESVAIRIDDSRTRLAIITDTDVTVVDAATGDEQASVARPAETIPAGWVGDRFVWLAIDGAAAWDPASGAVEPIDAGMIATRFAFDSPDVKFLVGRPDDGRSSCFAALAPYDLGVTGPTCSASVHARVLTASPDGRHLLAETGPEGVLVVDTEAALGGDTHEWRRLGVPADHNPVGVWWESDDTVLVAAVPRGGTKTDGSLDHLVRCRVDDGACERAPMPEIGGAPALWFFTP